MTTATSGANKNTGIVSFVAPDGGWGWVVVFASFSIHFIMDGITYALGAYLTAFTEIFHVSRSEASLVHSILPAVTLISGNNSSIYTHTQNLLTYHYIYIYFAYIRSIGILVHKSSGMSKYLHNWFHNRFIWFSIECFCRKLLLSLFDNRSCCW